MSTPSVTYPFPYAPKLVANHVRANLPTTTRVATQVPAKYNSAVQLVTIESAPATGVSNMALSTRRLIIQCWNSDEETAGLLAERVRQILVDAPRIGVKGIRGVNVIGEPGRFDDPDTGLPRFQLTVDVLLRASNL